MDLVTGEEELLWSAVILQEFVPLTTELGIVVLMLATEALELAIWGAPVTEW